MFGDFFTVYVLLKNQDVFAKLESHNMKNTADETQETVKMVTVSNITKSPACQCLLSDPEKASS